MFLLSCVLSVHKQKLLYEYNVKNVESVGIHYLNYLVVNGCIRLTLTSSHRRGGKVGIAGKVFSMRRTIYSLIKANV